MKNLKLEKILFIIYVSLFCVASSCNKDDDSHFDSFSSLVAAQDTLVIGDSTTITANATGTNLTYTWAATAGDILESGCQIIYAAPPCTPGNNDISCFVSAENNTEKKTITITVVLE